MTSGDLNPDLVDRALRKRASGRGTTNSEKTALARFERGDRVAERSPSTPFLRPDPERTPAAPSIDDVEFLRTALRRMETNSGDGADALSVLQALIASGATFEEFTICDSGTPASRWIPTWTSDPTPP